MRDNSVCVGMKSVSPPFVRFPLSSTSFYVPLLAAPLNRTTGRWNGSKNPFCPTLYRLLWTWLALGKGGKKKLFWGSFCSNEDRENCGVRERLSVWFFLRALFFSLFLSEFRCWTLTWDGKGVPKEEEEFLEFLFQRHELRCGDGALFPSLDLQDDLRRFDFDFSFLESVFLFAFNGEFVVFLLSHPPRSPLLAPPAREIRGKGFFFLGGMDLSAQPGKSLHLGRYLLSKCRGEKSHLDLPPYSGRRGRDEGSGYTLSHTHSAHIRHTCNGVPPPHTPSLQQVRNRGGRRKTRFSYVFFSSDKHKRARNDNDGGGKKKRHKMPSNRFTFASSPPITLSPSCCSSSKFSSQTKSFAAAASASASASVAVSLGAKSK